MEVRTSQAVQTKCEAQLGAVRFAPALRGTLARPSSLAAFYHTPSMCGFFFFFSVPSCLFSGFKCLFASSIEEP